MRRSAQGTAALSRRSVHSSLSIPLACSVATEWPQRGVAYLSTASAHRSAKRRFMRFDAALHAAGPWCVAAGASHVDDTQSIDRTDSRNGTFVVKAFLLDAIDAMASERAPA